MDFTISDKGFPEDLLWFMMDLTSPRLHMSPLTSVSSVFLSNLEEALLFLVILLGR
jgi:hypothetical protein